MKKLALLLLIGIVISPALVNAQDDVKRPKNIGVSDFDNFKNSSFDIREKSATLKTNVTQIDNEIKNYSGTINTVGVDKLKTNLSALKESRSAVKVLKDKIGGLDNDGKALLDNAKNVKPKMKSVSATKNTNQSMKSLGLAKDDLKAVSGMLDTDIKLITNELTSRGEPIE